MDEDLLVCGANEEHLVDGRIGHVLNGEHLIYSCQETDKTSSHGFTVGALNSKCSQRVIAPLPFQ